jgi:hypothetical protein
MIELVGVAVGVADPDADAVADGDPLPPEGRAVALTGAGVGDALPVDSLVGTGPSVDDPSSPLPHAAVSRANPSAIATVGFLRTWAPSTDG